MTFHCISPGSGSEFDRHSYKILAKHKIYIHTKRDTLVVVVAAAAYMNTQWTRLKQTRLHSLKLSMDNVIICCTRRLFSLHLTIHVKTMNNNPGMMCEA